MRLSMCSDYARDRGNAERDLIKIAEAGFDGVQWIHHWCTDFIYTKPEISQIGKWLRCCHLELFDLHGTDGVEKRWYSETEYERQAGVELVKNRVEMTRELGGKVVVMHIPRLIPDNSGKWDQLRKSLDETEKFCADRDVKIAVENIFYDEFNGIGKLMSEYSPNFLGICYDSGHGNMGRLGLSRLARFPDRLLALHLHDNNGYDDQHKPLFSGTIDWNELAETVAKTTYSGPLTLETGIRNSGISDEAVFLKQEFEDSRKLAGMITKKKNTVRRTRKT